jgi:2,4-dienoyl-CoA reductase (NADPH2)
MTQVKQCAHPQIHFTAKNKQVPMPLHERFRFKHQIDLEAKIAALGLTLPLDVDLAPLGRRVKIGALETPNALAIHPLECRDSTPEGAPSELTLRRYQRFAAGGAGLLWFEATAIVPEGRSAARQLLLNRGTLPEFAQLWQSTQQAAVSTHGPAHRPVGVIELTHSGRYTTARPVIAVHDETLDAKSGLPADYALISDGELEALEERFVEAARLAALAGFQAVDIKACHGYLVAELLGARQRPGHYGGSFENRTRFLVNVVGKIQAQLGAALAVTVRLNVYDGLRGGWGVGEQAGLQAAMDEPIRLVRLLYSQGVRMVNLTAGNPYCNPHIGRPFDIPMLGEPVPDEHPLQGVARLFGQIRQVQQAVPEMVIVGTGYSWLRQYLGQSAAANLRQGWMTLAGVGRMALAYPDFARDLLTKGQLDPKKTCLTCSRCSQLMREGGPAGCVILDPEIYRSLYRQKCSRTEPIEPAA